MNASPAATAPLESESRPDGQSGGSRGGTDVKTSTPLYIRRPLTGGMDFADVVQTEWSDVDLELYADARYAEWEKYATSGDTQSAEFLRHRLEIVAAEQERRVKARELNAKDPLAPHWTESKQRAFDQHKQLIEYLRDRWPIERFVTELMAVKLSDAGTSKRGRCPFPDHGPTSKSGLSFHVYPDDNHWHCFGCGRHGDVFDMVGLYFGLDSFRAQIDKLAEATPDLPKQHKRTSTFGTRKRKGVRLQGGKVVAA